MGGLRPPVTRDQTYLSAMCGLLAEQNRLLAEQTRLLGEVLDRLPTDGGGQPVEDSEVVTLREPAEKEPPAEQPNQAGDTPAGQQAQKPRRPAKATSAATRRGTKGAG